MTSLNPHPELVDGVDLDAIAAAVRGCAGVDDLDAGTIGSAASYLPGRRIAGLRVEDERVTVQVRARWGVPIPDTGRQIQSALATLVGSRKLDVVVSDVADPPSEAPLALPAGDSGSKMDTWTANPADAPVAPTSAPITPIVVETPPRSSPA